MAEYSSNGKGNLGVTLGAIGTGLGVLGNIGNGLGILGCNENTVTKRDLDNAIILAQKDSEIALLKSEQNTEVKIADVYERIMTRVNQDQRDQAAVNAAQSVYNATNGATVACINTQVQQLMGLTALHIPADNVCPAPMPKYNSWTAPTNG